METPIMNSILEEDSPPGAGKEFFTPVVQGKTDEKPSTHARPFFASPSLSRPNSSAFYSAKDGNNSSSSLIYNSTFTFGENTANAPPVPPSESRRNSLKYVPGPQLAPPTSRNRSPTRSGSPEPRRKNLDSPFNFGTQVSNASRTSFRKGHRYKHSSVSMNFFQEPEVNIPLNIAKSLPIPDLNDLLKNLSWPRAHTQLIITLLQFVACIVTFQLGHTKSWSNFITLSHFITYDIIGSLIIIVVENLSHFEVWSTGTITFPFGLNRIDVASSFASAVSLCFVGLDLVFHMVEEFIVFFVETAEDAENHDEIASSIPHSHHSEGLELTSENFDLWYLVLFTNFILSFLSLWKTFYANKNSKLKTKNPLITISYTFYLAIYPSLFPALHAISDYLAATLIAIFILVHGLTIAEWTSTILLLGFSTTTIPASTLLHNPIDDSSTKSKAKSITSTLNLSTQEPTVLKSKIKEEIEKLTEFVAKCDLKHEDLVIAKVSFNLYIVLIKLTLKGGSNDDELKLRLAIDKCIKKVLPSSETTIEVDRI